MKKLTTYLSIFFAAVCFGIFGQTPDKEIKPLSKGIYSKEGKKEFHREKKDKEHVFKPGRRIFRKHYTASTASVRSNHHFAKELKNERNAKYSIYRREKVSSKKTAGNIRTKRVLHLKRRKQLRHGEK